MGRVEALGTLSARTAAPLSICWHSYHNKQVYEATTTASKHFRCAPVLVLCAVCLGIAGGAGVAYLLYSTVWHPHRKQAAGTARGKDCSWLCHAARQRHGARPRGATAVLLQRLLEERAVVLYPLAPARRPCLWRRGRLCHRRLEPLQHAESTRHESAKARPILQADARPAHVTVFSTRTLSRVATIPR